MNYDLQLVPRLVQRTEEEIQEFLEAEYREFLVKKVERGDVWALLSRLIEGEQKAVIEDLIDRVMEHDSTGRKDREFLSSLTSDEVNLKVL